MMELQNFGWNALTASFIGTLFFSFWTAWGLYDQNKKIWNNDSGEAVSKIWFICAAGFFCSAVVYGISIKSLALEVWREKKSGVVSIKMLSVFVVSSTFWLVYSFIINDTPLVVFSFMIWIIFVITMLLWWKYRPDTNKRKEMRLGF